MFNHRKTNSKVINMKSNIHKKITFEDKFARKYFCKHARLNSIRQDKKEQHKKFRRLFKQNRDDNNDR